jgi:hypothetical protein
MSSSIAQSGSATPPDAHESTRKLIVNLVGVVFWLMILEGALRKWALPSLNQLLFFLKDPFVLYVYYLVWRKKMWPSPTPIIWATLAIMVAFIPLIMMQVVANGINPLVCAYGYRMYFFYIPLAFIIGEHFRGPDLRRLISQAMIFAIPMAALCILQYRSPMDAFINRDPTGSADIAYINDGQVRPSGTFTHSLMMPMYIGMNTCMLLSMWFVPAKQRGLPLILMGLATAASLGLIGFTGNRGSFFFVGFAFLASIAAACCLPSKKSRTRAVVTLVSIVLFAVGVGATVLREGINAMIQRNEIAESGEGSILTRALSTFTEGGDALASSSLPWFGVGIGLGSGGGAIIGTGQRQMITGEGEWVRVINECGVGGLVYLAYRLVLCTWICWQAAVSVRRTGNALPLVLCGITAPILIFGQITFVGTVNAFGWLMAGFNIAANNIGLSNRFQSPPDT